MGGGRRGVPGKPSLWLLARRGEALHSALVCRGSRPGSACCRLTASGGTRLAALGPSGSGRRLFPGPVRRRETSPLREPEMVISGDPGRGGFCRRRAGADGLPSPSLPRRETRDRPGRPPRSRTGHASGAEIQGEQHGGAEGGGDHQGPRQVSRHGGTGLGWNDHEHEVHDAGTLSFQPKFTFCYNRSRTDSPLEATLEALENSPGSECAKPI
jgi:hypothetical protein